MTDQITFRNGTTSVRPIVRHRIMQTEMAEAGSMSALGQKQTYAIDGDLISYGPNVTEVYRQCGNYVGQILKGAKTGRPSGRSTDKIRIRHQSQDCQIPWASYSVGADFIRRRGD